LRRRSASHRSVPGTLEGWRPDGLGVDFVEMWRHAAEFVDKILKGASPETLPVEQPTKFDLPTDLKIAKAFSLTLPISLVYRANHVIRDRVAAPDSDLDVFRTRAGDGANAARLAVAGLLIALTMCLLSIPRCTSMWQPNLRIWATFVDSKMAH
jgi:hypothetical protein